MLKAVFRGVNIYHYFLRCKKMMNIYTLKGSFVYLRQERAFDIIIIQRKRWHNENKGTAEQNLY